jgi:transketolase
MYVMSKMEAIREAYGIELARLGADIPELVVLDADVSKSTRTVHFAGAFPDRFFNFGIAEQNMMSAAAGMATMGMIPIVNTFSFLATYRAADQFRTSIVYPNLNVKVAANYGGLSDSFDGPTHQTIADIAWVRALPNVAVIVPSDAVEMRSALSEIIRHNGPVWFRLCRAETEVYHDRDYKFQFGKAEVVRDGKDVALIGCGAAMPRVLKAAGILISRGIEPLIMNIHTLKPLDYKAIYSAAAKTGAVVTVEEHNIIGGLGSAVCEVVAQDNLATVRRLGIPDTFAESGPYDDLLDRYGLNVDGIVEASENAIRNKKKTITV